MPLCRQPARFYGGGSVQHGSSAAFEVAAHDWHLGAEDKRYWLGRKGSICSTENTVPSPPSQRNASHVQAQGTSVNAPQDEADLQVDPLLAEKWNFDKESRLRELALKERDQANKDAEVRLKQEELRAFSWKSPLTVAILATAVAGAGNAIVAVVNGSLLRDLESNKRGAELVLERSKAESSRILEMIKTGDIEKAAKNLDFLLQAGLVTDDAIVKKLAYYLDKRPPGTGPSLPATDSRFTVDSPASFDPATQAALQDRLNRYLDFLEKIGFPPSTAKVKIQIEPKQINNAYYDGSKIFIDMRLIGDPVVALREYTHHVLGLGQESRPWKGQYAAVEGGLADYFEATVGAGAAAKAASNWIMGELTRKMNELGARIEDVPLQPEMLAGLIRLVDSGTISGPTAKDVFEKMYASGRPAAAIVEAEGLGRIDDEASVEAAVRQVLTSNGDAVKQYRAGKKQTYGFLVGQVIKSMGGKANPALVNALVRRELDRDPA